MSVIINDAHLTFKEAQRRREKTTAIVLHHSAVQADQSVQMLNDFYKTRIDSTSGKADYIGIGYNYVIYRNGEIWKGREEWAVGGHAGPANGFSIGICCEGDYESDNAMPQAQLDACVALIKDIFSRYGKLEVKRHKDYMATDCPGAHFPFDQIVSAVFAEPANQPAPQPAAPAQKSTFPGKQYFGAGKVNDYILQLDKALIAHGYAKYYKYGANGASRSWGNGTFTACRAFQQAQGWRGADADGIPGPVTWERLGL